MEFLRHLTQQQRKKIVVITAFMLFVISIASTALLLLPDPWEWYVGGGIMLAGVTFILVNMNRTKYASADLPEAPRTIQNQIDEALHASQSEPTTDQIPRVPLTARKTLPDYESSVELNHPKNQPSLADTFEDGPSQWDDTPGRHIRSLFLLRHTIFRHIMTDENGDKWLVVNMYTRASGGRFKKKSWERTTTRALLVNSSHVNVRLAKKTRFIPSAGDNAIHWCKRSNWWNKGWQRIGVFAAALALPVGFYVANDLFDFVFEYTAHAILFWTLACAICFYPFWIQRRCRYVLLTEKRIDCSFHPPLNIPPEKPHTMELKDISSGPTFDNSHLWKRIGGYGTLRLGGSSQKGDELFENGVEYVSDGEVLVALINKFKN